MTGRALLLPLFAVAAQGATFYKDVVPILQQRCQECHRKGEIGPMPLITYAETRPWAKAIREVVTRRKMPPWFADPHFGHFANDPSLSLLEIQTIQDWVDTGAAPGSPQDAPRARRWPDEWSGTPPDLVVTVPRPFAIPAKAVIDYQYVILPLGFSFDRWARSIEIRPSNRAVVHHAVLYVREPGSDWLRNVPPGIMYAPPPGDRTRARQTTADILAIYSPGAPIVSLPAGMAKKIPAGSDLVLQLHYTAGNVAASDQTSIGLTLSTEPPKLRVLTLQMGQDRLNIPPGEPAYRARVAGTLPHDALLLSFFPHMHLRGSSFEYDLVRDGGAVETLLKVNPYDFYWQLSYRLETPLQLHRGDRLAWIATFDNSVNNPKNPDAAAEVHWGEQSWEEMMIGFFDVAVDPNLDKAGFFVRSSSAQSRVE